MDKFIATLTVATLAFLFWVTYMANTGQDNFVFGFLRGVPDGDKYGHAALYGLLTLCANYLLRFRCLRLGPAGIYWGTLGVTAFVLAEEWSQQYFPLRAMDSADLLADAIGIGAFTLLSYIVHRFTDRRQPPHDLQRNDQPPPGGVE